MHEINQDSLKPFAKKYTWWKTPDEAVLSPELVIAQVMDIGDYSGVQVLVAQFGDDVLKQVLAHVQAGQFSESAFFQAVNPIGHSHRLAHQLVACRKFNARAR
jgi:hypothetical protein